LKKITRNNYIFLFYNLMNNFKKEERLCSGKLIDLVFKESKSYYFYPFKILWKKNEFDSDIPVKVLISVSKKNHKKAVTRNLIKRRIKESYRKNKFVLYNFLKTKNVSIILTLLYISKEIESYKEIESKIVLILQRFETEFEKHIKQNPYIDN